jgi:hypothetical protein
MIQINIYGTPPTPDEVRKMRKGQPFEDTMAFKVMMFTPVPGVDMIAGLATAAIEEAIYGKDLQDSGGVIGKDWSESPITQVYVDKVRAQDRELMAVEVDALVRHLSFERAAKATASVFVDSVLDKGKESLSEALKKTTDHLKALF